MSTPRRILATNFLSVPRAYFDATALPSLEHAQAHAARVTRTYRIAETTVMVHCYGAAGHDAFSRALAHHAPSSDAPDLVVHAWDDSAADAAVMPPPWDDPAHRGAAPDEHFFGVYVSGEESLNFYDPIARTGYFWTHDARRMPDWSLGAPLRTILHWFLQSRDVHFLHGAVVGTDNAAVLLTAKSGSGKSTTSLSALLSGMTFVGDDYVAVTDSGAGVTAHSLYGSAKVRKDGLALFPELAELVWNTYSQADEKAVLFLADTFPTQLRASLPVTAILVPKITGGSTRIVPASKLETLAAAAPTTLLQLPLAETEKLSVLKRLIEKVPCFRLELGPDIRAVPDAIRAFLDGQSGILEGQ